jgi:beta-N-acetylhexosaminidase
MRINRGGRAVLCALLAFPTVALAGGTSARIRDHVDQMSLREKVGQLVMFSVAGTALTDAERVAIRRNHFGGVILFSKNYRDRAQLENLTRQIQRAAQRGSGGHIRALISVDQEGGVVKRFPDMPPRYSHPQLGDMNRKSVAYGQGRATGRAWRSAGVNVDLAPVADLDLPPEHVMRSRSFGSNRFRVGKLARAFGRGLQSGRVAAAVKHFPGLGGATMNSDFGRAYVYRSKRQLHQIDAAPFQRAIEGGARMVMLSHALYVNDGGDRPASLNHYIATERLRGELGFEGVAISDALEPVAWFYGGSTSKACKGTVKAGVDIALIVGNYSTASACAERIYNGVRRGQISVRRVDQAVRRVLELKDWLGLFDP